MTQEPSPEIKPLSFTKREARFLGGLALFGALIPNGIFCYYFFTAPEVTKDALSNPISLVFIIEAFILMALFAWLLRKTVRNGVGATRFVVMSLLGSMVFSIPATLYLMFRKER